LVEELSEFTIFLKNCVTLTPTRVKGTLNFSEGLREPLSATLNFVERFRAAEGTLDFVERFEGTLTPWCERNPQKNFEGCERFEGTTQLRWRMWVGLQYRPAVYIYMHSVCRS
jgi:hypothetical protein